MMDGPETNNEWGARARVLYELLSGSEGGCDRLPRGYARELSRVTYQYFGRFLFTCLMDSEPGWGDRCRVLRPPFRAPTGQ